MESFSRSANADNFVTKEAELKEIGYADCARTEPHYGAVRTGL